MEVRLIETTELSEWNKMVDKSINGTLFHTTTWLMAYGCPVLIYGVFDNSRLVGGFAITRYRGAILRPAAGQPALTPYGGFVTTHESDKYVTMISRQKEIASLVAGYIKRDFVRIDFRCSPDIVDMQPFIWAGYKVGVRYTYIVDLTDLDRAWDEMQQKRRNDIRKAEKAGYFVHRSVELNQLLDIIKATLERQCLWRTEYSSIIRRYDKSLRLLYRRETFGIFDSQRELVAGVYIAWDNKRSYYLWGGYKASPGSGKYRGAPALALWEAMKFTRNELGLHQFDFEGSMNPSIERFFRKFGGRLVPTFTASWINPRWFPYRFLRSGLYNLKKVFRKKIHQ